MDAAPVGREEQAAVGEPLRARVERVVVRHARHPSRFPDGDVAPCALLDLERDAQTVGGDARQVDLGAGQVEQGLGPAVLEPEPLEGHLPGSHPGHVGDEGAPGEDVRVGGPLPLGDAGAAPGPQVHPPQVAPQPVVPVVILDGDHGLGGREQREGPVGRDLGREPEIQARRGGAPDALRAVEPPVPVGDEGPVRRPARVEDPSPAPGDPFRLRDRRAADLGHLRLVAIAQCPPELAPERREVLAAERVLGHHPDGEGPDEAPLLRQEGAQPFGTGALVEEGEEAPPEQVPHVAERPVERRVRHLGEREEPALEHDGAGVHVEEGAGVAPVSRSRLVEHRHALGEPGRDHGVGDEHLAEDDVDRRGDASPHVHLDDVHVLVGGEGEEPVGEVVQVREGVRRRRHEVDGVVGEDGGEPVGLVGAVGQDHLGLPGRKGGKGRREQVPGALQSAGRPLGQRLLPLVVVDAEVGRLERAPAQRWIVLAGGQPRGEGEEEGEETRGSGQRRLGGGADARRLD